jgi:hypothetical protein
MVASAAWDLDLTAIFANFLFFIFFMTCSMVVSAAWDLDVRAVFWAWGRHVSKET